VKSPITSKDLADEKKQETAQIGISQIGVSTLVREAVNGKPAMLSKVRMPPPVSARS
jgi:hypothetical protein